jgi:hypothetical protein
MQLNNFPPGAAAVGVGAITSSYIGYAANSANQTTYTWSGVSIGAADATRMVVVVFYGGDNGAPDVSSCSIGGVSATFVTHYTPASNRNVAIAWRAIAAGTTADLSITFNASQFRAAYGVYRLVKSKGAAIAKTAHDTNDATTSTQLSNSIATGVRGGAYIMAAGGAPDADATLSLGSSSEDFSNDPEDDTFAAARYDSPNNAAIAGTSAAWTGDKASILVEFS